MKIEGSIRWISKTAKNHDYTRKTGNTIFWPLSREVKAAYLKWRQKFKKKLKIGYSGVIKKMDCNKYERELNWKV